MKIRIHCILYTKIANNKCKTCLYNLIYLQTFKKSRSVETNKSVANESSLWLYILPNFVFYLPVFFKSKTE